MDQKIDICRNIEWNPNIVHMSSYSLKEIEQVENDLINSLDITKEYSLFLLGQLYFEQKNYKKAFHYFEIMSSLGDYQSMYQLAVMCFDALDLEPNLERGFNMMLKIVNSTNAGAKHLVCSAAYNIGRAFFHGYGINKSEKEAEKYWIMAADPKNSNCSIKAQSSLGLFYSLSEYIDLEKAFFYHYEASQNGNLESQGCLGVMYLNGFGTKKSDQLAYNCFKEASNKGSIYATGNLIQYYYKRQLFSKAVEIALKLVQFSDIEQICKKTECLMVYIIKGFALAYFYYARCLTRGRGANQNEELAKTFYYKSFNYDKEIFIELNKLATLGLI